MIGASDYERFLGEEYLGGYIDCGGSAVKLAVTGEAAAALLLVEGISEAGRGSGCTVATVDGSVTRLHLLEQVFFEVARQVNWDSLAARTTLEALSGIGYPPPSVDGDLSVDRLAAHYRVDARELTRDVDRELQRRVYHDYAMVQEFRVAMLWLCQAQLSAGQVAEAEHAAVLDWLTGELHQISALRSALIFRRIARHNARQMLFSLAHWLAANGSSGLVLILDARRLGIARRPSPEDRQGYCYSKATLIDAYEVFRQLVDNTDELAHCLIVVLGAPELLTDHVRGLDAYHALKLRVFDEVRDRRRDNPFSLLVRLAAS
ncbi:MAG: BREX system ATP-binding domain-containing protein [Acidimicrobiales bacterium]